MSNESRAAFEAWFESAYPLSSDRFTRPTYQATSVNDLMVAAWQASRKVALNEAADAIKELLI